MPKQIQIGYDKVPAPVTKQFPQLVDIEGIPLTDSAGNPLLTEEDAILGSFARAEAALSTVANNTGKEQSVPIVEQFPLESEVSSSLLGVPRGEEQLSLFSDVSTYGLDEDNWNYYTFSEPTKYPNEWFTKENTKFGRRQYPDFYEGTEEQALYLESFPTQYTFPRGPIESREAEPSSQFVDYMNFIALGKVLYKRFVGSSAGAFAELYFLNDDIQIVANTNGDVINIDAGEFQYTQGDRTSGFLLNAQSYFDIDYGSDLQSSFDQIEKWTELFIEIQDGTVQFPDLFTGGSLNFVDTDDFDAIQTFAVQNCRPGASSTAESFAILESKNTYRYQPGRISGFTFGIRLQADPQSSANYIEWGCSNSTDEYMFQLVGSRLNIVRRSVVPFPQDLLEDRFGKNFDDQILKYPVGLGNENPLWETVFERRDWNGDKLDGSGPSGYILSFEDVTMYKIEFSWYGAIGAKFYAYVPVDNGEARWVLMHTLVIENGMDGPIMQNPDMKFKYLLYATETSRIFQPLYVFKYGSSYYIDGGDEGTIRLSTFTTDSKEFLNRKPIIGILPKESILNQDGFEIDNFKKGYPDTISVASDANVRIDIEEVIGAPSGQHFTFQPSLINAESPFSRELPFIFGTEGAGGNQAEDQPAIDSISLRESELPSISNVTGFIFDASYIEHPTEDLSIFNPGDEIIVSGSTAQDGRYLVLSYDQPNNELSIRYLPDSEPNITVNGFPGGDDANADTAAVSIKTTGIKETEDEAKLIGDGIYNVYLQYESNAILNDQLLSSAILRRREYLLGPDTINKFVKTDGQTLVEAGDRFDARVSAYNTITASTVPIYANEFIVHFMVPNPRDPEYSSYHYADFGFTFTSSVPQTAFCDNGEQRLAFVDPLDPGLVPTEIDLRLNPFVEYHHYDSQFDFINKAEYREWDPAFGERFMIDSRQPAPDGGNNGYIAAFKGSVTFSDYDIQSNVEQTQGDPEFANGIYRLYFASISSFPSNSLLDEDPTSLTSEVGINTEGTGWFYVGQSEIDGADRFIRIKQVDTGPGITIQNILDAGSVQTKQLVLEDQWQLSSFPSGVEVDPANPPERRFTQQEFVVGKALRFNSQPFYLVMAFRDYAAVNNISVEEITPEARFTHTPQFITGTTESQSLTYDRFGNSSENNPPPNFKDIERLSGLRYDSQTENPLRPGNVIYSFYVEENKPETFRLDNIFNYDRKSLSRGQLNNKAIFFTATSTDGVTSGNIEMSLTSKEQ